MKRAFLFILITLVVFFSEVESSSAFPKKYDHWFSKYAHTYFARMIDWRWFKCQAIAESNLNPAARNPTGARGIMQLMPYTSQEIARELGIPHLPSEPELNIHMGVFYDRKMWAIWDLQDPQERMRFMFGSYNAGPGTIKKAKEKAELNGSACQS